MKSWEAARQQCREEGYSEGVGEADLAYFETSQELQEVIGKYLQDQYRRQNSLLILLWTIFRANGR